MELTYCPCKGGKRNTNCFPGDIVKCNKSSNNKCRSFVNDVHEIAKKMMTVATNLWITKHVSQNLVHWITVLNAKTIVQELT